MKYLIIGLDSFGMNLSRELSRLGHEVVVVDEDEKKIDDIKDEVATSYIFDATDLKTISAIPFASMDAVFVCLGQDFGISIKLVALLKKMDVKNIYVRSIDDIHKVILESIGVTRVLTPLRNAAKTLATSMNFGSEVSAFEVDEDHAVLRFRVPKPFAGHKIADLDLETEFGIRTIAVNHPEITKNFLGGTVIRNRAIDISSDYTLIEGDELVCYGKYDDFRKMIKAI